MPGAPGRARFGHALIRDTLYDGLTAARRMQLHREVGEALEAVYSSDPEPHLAELAQHFVAAAPLGVGDKAIEYARRAGDSAAVQLAFEEAARHYAIALTLVDDQLGAASCCSRSATPRRGRAIRRLRSRRFGRRRSSRSAAGSPSTSRAPRSATAAGSRGHGPAPTRASCRCWSVPSRRSTSATVPRG